MESGLAWSGVLVTSASVVDAVTDGRAYRGAAYGCPWPLESLPALTEEEAELNRTVRKIIPPCHLADGRYPPSVVPDVDLAKRYAAFCLRRGIAIRFLLCATDSPVPQMDIGQAESLLQTAVFLGYDYVLNECDFSGLYDDLTPPPTHQLGEFCRRLNRNGLFDDLDDLEGYVSTRWDYVRASGERSVDTEHGRVRVTELEDSPSFWKCGVWEIPWPV